MSLSREQDVPGVTRMLGRTTPDRVALEDELGAVLTYGELGERVRACGQALSSSGRGRFGLCASNGFDWVVADLAALAAGVTLVPLPHFFSETQVAEVIESASLDALLAPRPTSANAGELLPGTELVLRPLGAPGHPEPDTAKITFTSGTTGAPKGAKLSSTALCAVADSLGTALETTREDRHLCVLPLSILLENVGGLYRVLLAGGRAILPDEDARGLNGSCRVDPVAMVGAIRRHRPTSMILMPGMLDELVGELERNGALGTDSLRFVGVGGAAVPTRLLERAHAVGIPAFEGYGLSESASVVSLNRPGHRRVGSTGRPLEHVRVRIAPDGEVLVAGAVFEGYVGTTTGPDSDGYWPTGDLGHLDEDGFLFLRGRKRNMLVTSFGRNVSPEWVEREFQECSAIRRAVVFGEGRPGLAAVLVPSSGAETAIAEQVASVRAELPDYARPIGWIVTTEELLRSKELLTSTGRPRRSRFETAFRTELDSIFDGALFVVRTTGDLQHGLLSDPARRDSA